jgi:hypothetical protein
MDIKINDLLIIDELHKDSNGEVKYSAIHNTDYYNNPKYPMDEFEYFISDSVTNQSNKQTLDIRDDFIYEINIDGTFKKNDHLFIINGALILVCIPLKKALEEY